MARFPDEQITIIIYDAIDAMFAFLALVCLIMSVACYICRWLEEERILYPLFLFLGILNGK